MSENPATQPTWRIHDCGRLPKGVWVVREPQNLSPWVSDGVETPRSMNRRYATRGKDGHGVRGLKTTAIRGTVATRQTASPQGARMDLCAMDGTQIE